MKFISSDDHDDPHFENTSLSAHIDSTDSTTLRKQSVTYLFIHFHVYVYEQREVSSLRY